MVDRRRRPVIYRDSIEPSKRRDNASSDKDKKGERPTVVFLAIAAAAQGYNSRVTVHYRAIAR